MPNYIPYLILTILSASTMAWLLLRTRQPKILVLYFSFVGMIYFFEVVIFVILKMYEYHPDALKQDYHDSVMGAIVSNFFSVPTAGTLTAVLSLRIGWAFVFGLLFGAIEWVFIHLGIFEHNAWKIEYTIVTLTFFFWFTRAWTKKLAEGRRVFQFLSLFTFTYCVIATVFFAFSVLKLRTHHYNIYDQGLRDDVLATIINGIIITILIVCAVDCFKRRWLASSFAILISLIGQFILVQAQLVKVHISIWLLFGIYLATYIAFCWLSMFARRVLWGFAHKKPLFKTKRGA